MEKIQVFNYGETPVRTVMQNSEPWWVLKDVCGILELKEPHRVAARLDEDERTLSTVIDSMGREQKTTIINESGLYKVILRSDKPEAKKFTRWVTHEVLPAIRKTGSYSVSPYKPKASSVGEVIKLVEMTRSMMEEQGCEPAEIAQAVKQVCDQFNINLPDFFVKPKEMTLQDAMDMVDFIYSHERGRGKRRPTYQEFVEVQVTMKRLREKNP
jgi:BRO-like protein